MNKYSRQDGVFSRTGLPFLDFWCVIANEVGDHRLEIDPSAKCVAQLFPENSVHPEHLKRLVLGSLKRHAGGLDQIIDLTRLLDELGSAAWELRQNDLDDLFDIELLEEIAWHISTRYPHLIEMPITVATPNNQVLSLSKYKTIKRNRRL